MTDPILDSARKLLKFGPAMPLPHADTVRALCRALIARTEALRALVDKLDVIEANGEFQGVWTLHHVHGGRYTGPTYVDELNAARAALPSAASEQDGDV